jgi:hypothetical protein
MKVDGRCHCGQIRYEAEINADQVNICHCTDCQTLSGTAYRVGVPTPAASFVLLSGTPKVYVKTADSGNKRAQAFCANCGTPIYAAEAQSPQTYVLRVGTLTQRAALPAKRQIWFHSAQPWATDIHSLQSSTHGPV